MIESLVLLVAYLIIAALVLGLLVYLLDYVGREFPASAPFVKVGRVAVVVVGVLACILLLLRFLGV